MKNLSNLEGFKSNFDLLPKIPMRMKLAAFCLTCFLSTASAGTLYSQSARISLDMRNASVEQVLQEIEESSEFYFMYNSKLVNVDRKVNIKVKDKSIETILNEMVYMKLSTIYECHYRDACIPILTLRMGI